MNEVHLWFGLDKLTLNFEPSNLPKEIVKVCKLNRHIFALTSSNSIYLSEVDRICDNKLVFTNTNITAIDITCDNKVLYFVTDNGQVFKSDPENLDVKEEIILKEDAKCCHGYKTSEQRVKVKTVAAEECSCLYVTENGQLWVSGYQPKLGLHDEVPQKVTFFENRYVISVACGSNFSIALVYKPGHFVPDKDNSDTDDDNEDVFVSDCPLCISSSTSQQSVSETCPLGLSIQQASDENYSTSSTSRENTIEDKKSTDDSTSASTDGKNDGKGKICDAAQELHAQSDADFPADKSSQNFVEHDDNRRKTGKVIERNENKSEVEFMKEEKKNEFFINTEAARQFLTRQLSWVSSYGGAGEDLVECAEASLARPSRIIKQNMSSVANLVYEGVKTVGDRGAILFRHMSGGSETSESIHGGLTDCGSFEELSAEDFIIPVPSFTSSLRCEESFWSSSCGTSERGEESEVGISERVATMVRAGTRLLSTELWSWGDITHGQLGTGDTVKRHRPTIISHLTGIGVCRIACGNDHALAVSLDGRMFAWGRNHHNQVSQELQANHSSPQQITCLSERVRSIAAGDSHSLFITHNDNVYYIGKDSNKSILKMDIPSILGSESTQKQIFSSRHISGCLNTIYPTSSAVEHLAIEQTFLEEMLLVQNALIKPLQKKGAPVQETNVYNVLCVCYNEILSFTCLNVQSLREYTDHRGSESSIVMIHHADEYIHAYKNYLNAVCDVTALSGFMHIAHLVNVPQKMFSVFHEHSKRNKKSQEEVVSCALLHPLKRLKSYKSTIQSLIRCNDKKQQSLEDKRTAERQLQDALVKWDQLWDEQKQKKNEADITRLFWEKSARLVELLRSPERRLIRESRSYSLSVVNSGRFSSHWFVLFTDVFVHVSGGTQNVHPLTTVWVDIIQDTDTVQNALHLTMPEETLMVYTLTPHEKMEWFKNLQGAIKKSLQKPHSHLPPTVRTAKYTFTKHHVYKDAKYAGRWCNGKLQGPGKLEWSDGKVYVGHFQNNQMNGLGRMEIPGIGTYEGQWKDGQQDGCGIMKYTNGDVYEGHFKDGVAHGHGLQKQGHFMASVASVYIGEWANGVKQGYGVMDDIVTGEKYLGYWSNNMKHGCGLIVTLDGIYYEGVFAQGVLTGHGVMVFEDGTHYEGEFRAAGVFGGKGTLIFNSGDCLEGVLHGAWNEGVKVTGTLHKNTPTPSNQLKRKPSSFGKLCVTANQKWKAIFRQCYQQLGVPEPTGTKGGKTNVDVQKVWENVAVVINTSQQERGVLSSDQLDTIPQFGRDRLDKESYQGLCSYLVKAFESHHHPVGRLLAEVTAAYTATYGGVRVHPLLLSHAVAELHSITARLYEVVRVLFPALPALGQELQLVESQEAEQECEVVSAATLLHPVLLPRVHSALFVLYALHNKEEDDVYWKRLLQWNKQPDMTLMAFLGIDQKFWVVPHHYSNHESPFTPLEGHLFNDAVETLQQLKTTFSPLEKLLVIQRTFEQMTRAVQRELGTLYLWTMDDLFPVFNFVVVRSRILQLGSEIHFIEDFMEPYLQNGELGIMFTTLKACYYQILQEKNSMSN